MHIRIPIASMHLELFFIHCLVQTYDIRLGPLLVSCQFMFYWAGNLCCRNMILIIY